MRATFAQSSRWFFHDEKYQDDSDDASKWCNSQAILPAAHQLGRFRSNNVAQTAKIEKVRPKFEKFPIKKKLIHIAKYTRNIIICIIRGR